MSLSVPKRRGFATFLVLWAIGLVALLLVAIQSSSFEQAAYGREALARVRAHWAARAGVEAQIAALTSATLSPDQQSALSVNTELANVAIGELTSATYSVRHFDGTSEVDGPLDAHSRLNVNRLIKDDLMLMDQMDEATAESILNWIGATDSSGDGGLGAAEGTYTGKKYPYRPRLGPVRSLRELELVEGVLPSNLRGQDANYNGVLDPAEDDQNGNFTLGWSTYLTASSELPRFGGYALSGQKRIDLSTASVGDIAARLRVDQSQAQAISNHATQQGARLSDFVRSDLPSLATSSSGTNALTPPQNLRALSQDQLKALLDEGSLSIEMGEEGSRRGKVNINTARRETLERFSQIETNRLDTLLSERDGRTGGFVSLADIAGINGIGNAGLAELMDHIDVRSEVFVATSRGRDRTTGLEVEIVAVLDRSTIPVVIRDLIVR